jgi:hypothetical protein
LSCSERCSIAAFGGSGIKYLIPAYLIPAYPHGEAVREAARPISYLKFHISYLKFPTKKWQ